EYTVIKGDTLWSITKRELVDAYQWPLVWMENRRINDPDLIFPGQVILIPIRKLRPEEPEGPWPSPDTVSRDIQYTEPSQDTQPSYWTPPEPSEPQKPTYRSMSKRIAKHESELIVKKEVIIEAGYITKYMPNAGEIQGAPSGRANFAQYDILYIWTEKPVEKGRKFYTVHKMDKIFHPITEELMGWAMKVTGVIQTLEPGDDKVRAEVLESYDLIEVGDPLDFYSEFFPPVTLGTPRSPEISGAVLTASYRRLISAGYDVMFIDKGMKDGIEVGDMFITLMPKTSDTVNGMFQIINVRNNTSLAVIHASEREITKGDSFRSFFDDQTVPTIEQ
ncbi:MAG: LysM peptidoglycan-binding domain-containing protein, partial [Thermodesulfovibrionales bacterium]|nr:LysM peptidoglycan-binding domain-containing protein [Thermodesulfovibrionales bacterium]